MRFDALELRRLGVFRDTLRLDLSQGAHGVHLIYGPNEAGKSTTLKALHWMLFGFPHHTHEFLYSNDSRAGGVVRNGKESLAFLRKKGRVATLESPDTGTLDADALAPFTGGIGLEQFERFHGLDHARLAEGGRELIEAKGDAGQALFSAASGLQEVRKLAEALQSEYEDIFKPRGKKTRLAEVRAAIDEARAAEKAAMLTTAAYEKLLEGEREAAKRCESLRAVIEDSAAQREWLERCQRAYTVLTELSAVRRSIEAAENEGVRPLRGDFLRDFQDARQRLAEAERNREASSEKLAELQEQLESLVVDTRFLDHEEAILELAQEAASIRSARKDRETSLVPEARARREQVNRTLRDLDQAAASDDPRAILPSAVTRAAINELAGAYSGLAARLESAEHNERQAAAALASAEKSLASAPMPVETQTVAAVLAKAQRLLGEAEALDSREHELTEQREHIEVRLLRIGRWQGPLDTARTLAVPGEMTIEQFKDDMAACERRRMDLEATREELAAEHGRVTQDIAKLSRGEAIPTEEELARLREHRDAAWTALRDAWLQGLEAAALPASLRDELVAGSARDGFHGDEPLAAFAWRMQRADEVADRLRREAERVADHAAARARLDQLEQLRQACGEDLADCAKAGAQLEADWAALWKPLGIAHGTPAEMLAWRKDWDALIRGLETHFEAAAADAESRRRIDAVRADLMDAWRAECPEAAAHATASLPDLADAAKEWLDDAVHARSGHAALAKECSRLRETDLPAAKEAAAEAVQAMKDWQKQWARHMKAIGLPKDALTGQAAAMLEGLDKLKEDLDALAVTEERIAAIDAQCGRFEAEAREVFAITGFDPGHEPPEVAARGLNAEREAHARDRTAQGALERQVMDEQSRLDDAANRLNAVHEALRQLCEEAGVESADELPGAAAHAAALREQRTRLDVLEQDLARDAMGEPLDAFEARVREEDPESLEGRIDTLSRDIERVKGAYDEAQQALGIVRKELQGADGAGAAAEAAQEAAEHEARAVGLAEEFARLALAHAMLTQAVQRYQEKHQGPMLTLAGRYFQALTLGSFQELRAGYDDKGTAVLLGVRPDDREIKLEGMSDGTADQLYLALRLAAIELQAQRGPVMPLILDDVLVNFDDGRSRAALEAFAALSSHTQVLMFTHHAHLVELARETLPEDVLFVHELPSRAAGNG